jgi:hypothetical protein
MHGLRPGSSVPKTFRFRDAVRVVDRARCSFVRGLRCPLTDRHQSGIDRRRCSIESSTCRAVGGTGPRDLVEVEVQGGWRVLILF